MTGPIAVNIEVNVGCCRLVGDVGLSGAVWWGELSGLLVQVVQVEVVELVGWVPGEQAD
jgi:hypothetical protein